jgi:hypothetical protein
VETQLKRVEALGGGSLAEVTLAKQEANSAREAIARAERVRGGVVALQMKLNSIGGVLVRTVDEIDRKVLADIQGTEPGLQAVPGVIASLSKASEIFVPAPRLTDIPAVKAQPVPKAGTLEALTADALKGSPEVIDLSQKVSRLKGMVIVLNGQADVVSGILDGIEKSKPIDKLKTCNVENVDLTFKVEPTEISFKAKIPSRQILEIRGSPGPYGFRFLKDPAPGLSVVQSMPGERTLTIVATDQTQVDNYPLKIWDRTEKSETVLIKVTESDAAPPKPAAPELKAVVTKLEDMKSQKTPVDVKGLAKVIITSAIADKDGSGIIRVTYRVQSGQTNAVTAADVSDALQKLVDSEGKSTIRAELDTESPGPKSGTLKPQRAVPRDPMRWGPTVAQLSDRQITVIQHHLCLPPTHVDGKWGTTTQSALVEDRNRRLMSGAEKTVPTGDLTDAESKVLLALNAKEAAKRCQK